MAAQIPSQTFTAPGQTSAVNVGRNGYVYVSASGSGYRVELQLHMGDLWVTVGGFNTALTGPTVAATNPDDRLDMKLPAGAAVRINVPIVRGTNATVTAGLVT